jgi:hypothetical protein
MTVTQVMNYLKRQQRESYQGKAASVVISQWEDYLRMCKELKKDLNDEMVYKPRELKRRHQEAVQELEVRRAELQAEAYSPSTERPRRCSHRSKKNSNMPERDSASSCR